MDPVWKTSQQSVTRLPVDSAVLRVHIHMCYDTYFQWSYK